MITGVQIRMARHALRWTAVQLANQVGITSKTVNRLEAENGIPASNSKTLAAVQSCFVDAGIEFIGTPEDRPGIRIGTPK